MFDKHERTFIKILKKLNNVLVCCLYTMNVDKFDWFEASDKL